MIERRCALRLAYITTYDAHDRANWSGSGHAIMCAMQESGLEVVPLGPLTTNLQFLGRLKRKFYAQVQGRAYEYEREPIPTRGYANQIADKLNTARFDVVFSPGSIPVSRLNCRQPIVIWADATFASYVRHYGLRLSNKAFRVGHCTESLAYKRCSLLIFSSEWAAVSAVSDYGISPSKVKVVPFGANFVAPPTRKAALDSIQYRAADRCRLITIGADWDRKNVARSIELASLLNTRGLKTELDIVGCQPPSGVAIPDYVNIVGFVDKRTAEGEQKLSSLLLRSHFHVLLPTAEAFGVVFAESNAHAVPNIASDVGGIPTAVVNDRGGRRFDLALPLTDLASYIETNLQDKVRYAGLAHRARNEFDERLNWRTSGALVRQYLEAALENSYSFTSIENDASPS